jgi:hypothetical protein
MLSREHVAEGCCVAGLPRRWANGSAEPATRVELMGVHCGKLRRKCLWTERCNVAGADERL